MLTYNTDNYCYAYDYKHDCGTVYRVVKGNYYDVCFLQGDEAGILSDELDECKDEKTQELLLTMYDNA